MSSLIVVYGEVKFVLIKIFKSTKFDHRKVKFPFRRNKFFVISLCNYINCYKWFYQSLSDLIGFNTLGEVVYGEVKFPLGEVKFQIIGI